MSESTGRIVRFFCNTNSRELCAKAMLADASLSTFTGKIRKELARVECGYLGMLGRPLHANKFDRLSLNDDLDWDKEVMSDGSTVESVASPTTATRDYHMSSVVSRIDEAKRCINPCLKILVGLFLIALHYGSYYQYCIIFDYILRHGFLKDLELRDLPRLWWDVSSDIFKFESFFGGKCPRMQPSQMDFKKSYVDDPDAFCCSVSHLKDIRQKVNTLSFHSNSAYYLYLQNKTTSIPYIGLFKLQFFLPMCALAGMIVSDALRYADIIQPAGNMSGGSYNALKGANVPEHQFSFVLKNICRKFGFLSRLSIGEAIACDALCQKN